ncbi:MAG: hypothetical protein KJN76_01090 [Eudoraea sp.]|nr:hypothetical protein [Eudoraea sp.]
MKNSVNIACFFCLLFLTNCVSIPKQAPELSDELGHQIRLIQDSHFILLDKYFENKRNEIDEYVNETWIPAFAKNLFELDHIQAAWVRIVNSDDDTDRVKFLTLVGPEIQRKINEKRGELVGPLNDLERDVKSKIAAEYDTAYSINNTLSSFLYSATKVADNRSRYLEKIGITDDKIESAIEETSNIVGKLVKSGVKAEESEIKIQEYLKKIEEIRNNLKKD